VASPIDVLAHYDVGAVRSIHAAGGTAGRTWRVDASAGAFFLRLRGARTSARERVSFDQGLRAYLAAAGLPCVAPLRTREGASWWDEGGRVYELYPPVEGEPYDACRADQRKAAAETLARLHLAAASYPAATGWGERVSQYAGLGVNETSDRPDDPRLLALALQALRSQVVGAEDANLLERCLERVATLARVYAGAPYRTLAGWVIHGDYTPGNLLFAANGQVAGVFDLDWAMPGARCRDVADGLYFFGAQRAWACTGDIWSLTDAAEWDAEGVRAFLAAYQHQAPLTAQELEAVPAAFTARWLSLRLEGTAKVAKAERWRFFARDIEQPLTWLDQHWPQVARG